MSVSEIRERHRGLECRSRISLRSIRATKEKDRKRNAERRVFPTSAPPPLSSPAPSFVLPRKRGRIEVGGRHRRGRGSRPAGRARLPAFHRGSCQRDCPSPRLGVRPCFLGLGRSARSGRPRPTGGERSSAAPRALPAPRLSQSSESTSRTGPSAGKMMPEPPECDSDEPPPAGTALAPRSRLASGSPSFTREIRVIL